MTDETTDQTEATEQQMPLIADQAAFLRVLGVDPNMVGRNSIRIEFNANGTAVVSFTTMLSVTPQALGMAFMASGGLLGGGADAQSEPVDEKKDSDNVTPLTKTGRRTATKKAAAAKKTAAKTTSKKTT